MPVFSSKVTRNFSPQQRSTKPNCGKRSLAPLKDQYFLRLPGHSDVTKTQCMQRASIASPGKADWPVHSWPYTYHPPSLAGKCLVQSNKKLIRENSQKGKDLICIHILPGT